MMKQLNRFGTRSVLAAVTLLVSLSVGAQSGYSPYVDDEGNISFPAGFRTSMVHLGSWFVPEGDASGFHDVYTERESVEAFLETGAFPDGATLVKELRASDAGDYTTGRGVSFATSGIKQWFVMIKNTEGRFADNPLWGEGWGWALFQTDDREVNVATAYTTDCLGCHVPARNTDWIYVEAYPTLQAE
jgi:hypothetical protein